MNLKIILCIAAAAAPCCLAQQTEKPTISLRFLSFPQQANSKPVELLVGENQTIQVDTPGHELSRAYTVQGLSTIVVGAMGKNEKKEPVFNVYGKAEALASPRQIVLLIRKGQNNEDGFTVVPLNADLKEFPGGGYHFINAAKQEISGKIGDKTFTLKPGQRSMLRPAADHSAGGCQVTLAYLKETKWKIFYDTRWSVNSRFRALVFFYQDPESGSLGVAPIMEML